MEVYFDTVACLICSKSRATDRHNASRAALFRRAEPRRPPAGPWPLREAAGKWPQFRTVTLSAMAGARSVGDAPAPRRQAGPAPETPASAAAPGSRKRARAPRAKKAAAAEAAAAADEDGIEDEDNVIVLADDSQDLVAPARARPAALLACGHRGQHPGAALGHLCV